MTSGMIQALKDISKDYLSENNTLKREVKDSKADKIELEIGDAEQVEFIPQAKIKRWDNETNFSIRRDNGARSFIERDGKIVSEGELEDVVMYELEPDEKNEDGGFEIEIHLKEQPASNRFEFSIQTKGLDFFVQPIELPTELKKTATIPENIRGSIAVYHSTKKNNTKGGKEYRAGKFCHIYRPLVIDADGDKVWGELEIDEQAGTLTVVVPENWLNKASYPVVVDPTFGYTSVGGTPFNGIGNNGETLAMIGDTYTPGEAGVIDSYHMLFDQGTGDGTVKMGVYKAGAIFDETHPDEIVVPASSTAFWGSVASSQNESFTDTDSFQIAWKFGVNVNTGFYFDVGSGGDFQFNSGSTYTSALTATPPDTSYSFGVDVKLSAYVTYNTEPKVELDNHLSFTNSASSFATSHSANLVVADNPNRYALVFIRLDRITNTDNTVTMGGTAMTYKGVGSFQSRFFHIYERINPAVGSNAIVVTSSSTTQIGFSATSLYNVDQTDPLVQLFSSNSEATTDQDPSGGFYYEANHSITTLYDNSAILAFGTQGNKDGVATAAGTSIVYDVDDFNHIILLTNKNIHVGSAGEYSIDYLFNSGFGGFTSDVMMMEVRAFSGAVPPPPTVQLPQTKAGGIFGNAQPKVKAGGTFANATMKVKQGGSF